MKKPKMTILFDANPLMGNRTGVGYYTTQLIEALAEAHPETRFVGYYYNFLARKQPPQAPVAANIAYRPIYHLPGPIINLLRRFKIEVPVELLAFARADFVLYPNFLNHPSLFGAPSANVIHDLTFIDMPEYVARKNLKDLLAFMPKHSKRSKFLVTVSEFGKRRIHEVFGVPLDNILVTSIPPETPRLASQKAERDTLQKLGIHGKYILTLGTIEPRKNLPNMIGAYLQLPQKLQQEYTFVITGKIGWNCEREVALLEQMKQEGKNILHVGYVTETERAALYHNATLFTWASHYEGFGMPILEAMSYGTPCAVSDIAIFHETSDKAALYFDQQNPHSIAAVWEQLLTDHALNKRLGLAGKQRADTYHWDDVAASLHNRIMQTLEDDK